MESVSMESIKRIKRRNYRIIFMVTGVLASIGFGELYWLRHKDPFLEKMNERVGFTLMDDNGNFFSAVKESEKKNIFIVFVPDLLDQKAVPPLTEFVKSIPLIKNRGAEVIFISKVDRDTLRSFLHAVHYTGKFFNDSSGTVGKLYHVWDGINYTKTWGYAYLGAGAKLLWYAKVDHPLGFAELKTQL